MQETARPRRVDVVIVGAGPFGLAMSHVLARRGIDHVVLERGDVGHSWRTERWASLRLLTPNWMTRLPGRPYLGDDPEGYMSAAEVAEFLATYARDIGAPVWAGSTVTRVSRDGDDYRVATSRGDWHCRALVIASGACNMPTLPRCAEALPATVAQLTPHQYREPSHLADGGVLVVGASATGLQLAQEIHHSGRRVTLAVGEHVRLPRVYRGRDIQWWMHAAGLLDQRIEDADDPLRARRVPSPQLVGTPERRTLDLNALRAEGVEIVGRLAAVRGDLALFSGTLRNVCALADLKMNRLLDAIDTWAERQGPGCSVPVPERFAPTRVGDSPRLSLRLGQDVQTVVWATGFRPDLHWLDLPVFDRQGALKHDRGIVTDAPGAYVLGLPFLRRRKSTFIHGAEDDARELGAHLAAFLARQAPATRTMEASTMKLGALPKQPRCRLRAMP